MNVSVVDPEPAEVAPSRRRTIVDAMLHPSTIFIAGATTALVLVVLTASWISFHAETWRTDWQCSAQFTSSITTRLSISIAAGASLVVLAGSTLWLGGRDAGRRSAGAAFWLAIVIAWIVVGAMLVTGSMVDLCGGAAL